MIRVALVDDQAMVRAGLARILAPADGFDVVAECADGQQVVEELPAVGPDVILMDVRMPRRSRRDEAAASGRRFRSGAGPHHLRRDEVLWGAIEAGAAGFVLKDRSAEELIAAVRAVAGGGAWFEPRRGAAGPRALPRAGRAGGS